MSAHLGPLTAQAQTFEGEPVVLQQPSDSQGRQEPRETLDLTDPIGIAATLAVSGIMIVAVGRGAVVRPLMHGLEKLAERFSSSDATN